MGRQAEGRPAARCASDHARRRLDRARPSFPATPKESLLVDAINYGETYQMPPKSKLPAGRDRHPDRMGAAWSSLGFRSVRVRSGQAGHGQDPGCAREGGIPGAVPVLELSAAPACLAARGRVGPRRLGAQPDRPLHPGRARRTKNLAAAPEAGKRTLIRRLSFDLTGLPPKPEDVDAFLADASPDAYERLVDRLLASPHYGERWARHWLDLVRYAETAGHEFDYDIPNAFRYRDYVIRAFNARPALRPASSSSTSPATCSRDPRRHPAEGFNESIIGTGFYFLGEGTHSPVDVREEQMRRIDNQIDVISKAFLGLTVACARCHDHKFDPITNQDYYALAGYLAQLAVSAGLHRPARSHRQIRERLARHQGQAIIAILRRHTRSTAGTGSDAGRLVLASCDCAPSSRALPAATTGREGGVPAASASSTTSTATSFDGWFVTGDAFGDRPTRAGDLRLDRSGELRRVGLDRAGPGAQRPRLRPAPRRPPLADLSRSRSRYIHFLGSPARAGGSTSSLTDSRRSAIPFTAD